MASTKHATAVFGYLRIDKVMSQKREQLLLRIFFLQSTGMYLPYVHISDKSELGIPAWDGQLTLAETEADRPTESQVVAGQLYS